MVGYQYLNIFFTTEFFFGGEGGRKYISIYFHHHIFGGENTFKFIFTTVFLLSNSISEITTLSL